jgi:stress response protein YsnF
MTTKGIDSMPEETIVAMFDVADRADAAIRGLEAAKVPSEAISRTVENKLIATRIKVPGEHAQRVTEILEQHNPIDLDAHAAADAGVIRLYEEGLSVGKRSTESTTRVRRYSVEVPVEQDVSLHKETVRVERRPPTDNGTVTGVDFSDKVVEMTEHNEEAVVGKTVRVKEEVSLSKEAGEHVETVKDSIRSQELEVERVSTGHTSKR